MSVVGVRSSERSREAVLWSMETRQDDGGVVVEMEATQAQEGKVTHCPSVLKRLIGFISLSLNKGHFHSRLLRSNAMAGCICDRLRDCEQRVIAEGDEQSLIAYSNGYNDALDYCIAAVQASPTIQDLDGFTYIDVTVDTVLADIRALQLDKT